MDKPFISNNLFKASGDSKLRGKPTLSAAYITGYLNQHGRLPWRVLEPARRRTSYTSVLFRFVHSGLVYKKSVNNMDLGFRRQTCIREPSDPSIEAALLVGHKNLFLGNRTSRRFRGSMWRALDTMKSRLKIILANKFKDMIEDVWECAQQIHDKRDLRLNAYASLDDMGKLLSRLFMDHVRIKLKCPEYAKYMKYPRTIGDYTTEGSLLGGHVTPLLKELFSQLLLLDGDSFRFVEKPTPRELVEVFEEHRFAKNNVFTFHSDDNMVTLQCVDGPVSFNLDISSCDISNGLPIFEYLLRICEDDPWMHDIVSRLVEQCKTKAVVYNPVFPKEKFRFKTARPIEYSGSLLTTTLNNIASLLISLSISFSFRTKKILRKDAAAAISKCAKSIGYLVTVEEWKRVEDSQFLKYSWSSTAGLVFNMGPLIRSLGSCDGDAPRILGRPKATVTEKLWEHARGVMLGTAHYGNNSILHALRTLFRIPSSVDSIDDTILHNRYGLSGGEVEGFVKLIAEIRPGVYINHIAVSKIMSKDYGYSPP